MTPDDEKKFMRLAIEVSRRSSSEPGKPTPKVGVVVVQGDRVLAAAWRGEQEPGEHAEFTVLEKKLRDATLAGATVYTTLEPCASRNPPKVDCARRLIERKLARVVIGMLDPNPAIRGEGVILLRDHNVATQLFPEDLAAEVEELNRDFRRAIMAKHADHLTRRKALATLRTTEIGGMIIRIVDRFWNATGRRSVAAERQALLQRSLFPQQQYFDLIGADAHPTAVIHASGTYVNEERAATALLETCNASRDIEIVSDPFSVSPGHSAICLGSNASNTATRRLLGPPEAPTFFARGLDFEASFQYSISTMPGRVVRIQDNREHWTDRRAVVDQSMALSTDLAVCGEQLLSDVLLVTKLPKRYATGTSIVLLAGVHGPAMRAVELLPDDIDIADLRILAKYAEARPYFQALFRVDGLTVQDGNTVARSISLIPDLLRPVTVRRL